MPDVVVCLSGGLDSTFLATMALKEGRLAACLVYRYGQPHAEAELDAARRWCQAHKVERVLVDLDVAGNVMAIGAGVAGPRVVPGRNMMMLSHAAQYAAARGLSEVWYGPTIEDLSSYPDCRPEFVEAFNRVASVYGITVVAPLIAMTKREIVDKAREVGMDIAATWSCYEPRWKGFAPHPCGGCDACVKRNAALGGEPLAELRHRVRHAWPGASVETRCVYALRRADGTVEETWHAMIGRHTFRGASEFEALDAALAGTVEKTS